MSLGLQIRITKIFRHFYCSKPVVKSWFYLNKYVHLFSTFVPFQRASTSCIYSQSCSYSVSFCVVFYDAMPKLNLNDCCWINTFCYICLFVTLLSYSFPGSSVWFKVHSTSCAFYPDFSEVGLFISLFSFVSLSFLCLNNISCWFPTAVNLQIPKNRPWHFKEKS